MLFFSVRQSLFFSGGGLSATAPGVGGAPTSLPKASSRIPILCTQTPHSDNARTLFIGSFHAKRARPKHTRITTRAHRDTPPSLRFRPPADERGKRALRSRTTTGGSRTYTTRPRASERGKEASERARRRDAPRRPIAPGRPRTPAPTAAGRGAVSLARNLNKKQKT